MNNRPVKSSQKQEHRRILYLKLDECLKYRVSVKLWPKKLRSIVFALYKEEFIKLSHKESSSLQ